MPTCCVCDREAEYLHHGLWWCEKHRPHGEEKPEPAGNRRGGFNGERDQSPGNLGLEWV